MSDAQASEAERNVSCLSRRQFLAGPDPKSAVSANELVRQIEIWKVKKLIKRLEAARGNGTSMISLIIRTCRPSLLSLSPPPVAVLL